MNRSELTFATLREQIVGVDAPFDTAFGSRLMTYCDYTASGRCLAFVESYLMTLQRTYANTHTEDDVSGRSMTQLLHEAEQIIKGSLHAGPNGKLITIGFGATAAIDKLQEILGVKVPPATWALLETVYESSDPSGASLDLKQRVAARRPVVFVGPYEHHSNEVTWRQGIVEVVEVGLDNDGAIDQRQLADLLVEERFKGRMLIGSFSAASNVTGMITPVHDIARLLHAHGAIACFDYAASGPYVEIDMCKSDPDGDGDPSLDAVFLSPHKFLGGPGSPGVLVFKQHIYRSDLPPTVGGGGTVEYVGPQGQNYIEDIETRERAGTPGVLQTMKAALAFEVKETFGTAKIEAREQELLARAFEQWKRHPGIDLLGNLDVKRRVGIASFNLKGTEGRVIHPRLVTVLLNDLFGIQSRAGCSCAGPYGHRLLGISIEEAQSYRDAVLRGYQGVKPGWCRLGFHYAMDDAEAKFIIDAISFLAEWGHAFVRLYDFDPHSGLWTHKDGSETTEHFSLDQALGVHRTQPEPLPESIRVDLYERWLGEAEAIARRLVADSKPPQRQLEGDLRALQFFML